MPREEWINSRQEKHWRVEVYREGERILCIENACVSGKAELTEADEETIRQAAYNLLGFIGEPEKAQ